MHSYNVVASGAALEFSESQTPEPRGSEVLVKVSRCGVCHTDLHLWDGYYDIGGGQRLELASRGITPPFTMGHEMTGTVVAAGPEAEGDFTGKSYLVYPWLGCGACRHCEEGAGNLCAAPRYLGVFQPGGYGDHVLLPHPRYLVDIEGIEPSVAAPYACSGLTAFTAIEAAGTLDRERMPVLIGAGGLGLMAISLLCAKGIEDFIVVDIDEGKLSAAQAAGAPIVIDGRSDDLAEQVRQASGGGPAAVIDFVGSGETAQFSIDVLRKAGRYIIVGLFGGQLTLPLPMLPIRALTITGAYCGSLNDLKALIDLVKSGRAAPIPTETRPWRAVNDSLNDLKSGKVTGRVVLDLTQVPTA